MGLGGALGAYLPLGPELAGLSLTRDMDVVFVFKNTICYVNKCLHKY